MKKALFLLPVLLVACHSDPQIPTTLSTEAALKLNEPRQLKSDLSGSVTWTSSQPEVIAVDGGKVTGLRLSTAPVTITAQSGSRKQSVELSTYGLELSMCTFNDNILMKNTGKLRLCALTKFRTKSGAIAGDPAQTADRKAVTIKDPDGKVVALSNTVRPAADGKSAVMSYNTDLYPQVGTYAASVNVGGEDFTAQATLDPNARAEGIQSPSMNLTADSYSIGGTFGAGTGAAWLWCYRSADRVSAYIGAAPAPLPVQGQHSFNVKDSAVRCDYVSYTANPYDFSSVTPAQVNMAWQQGQIFRL